MLEKILIINTGGTIGMVPSDKNDITSPLRPANNWLEIIEEHPILKKFPTDYYQFSPLIDSSDMSPSVWTELGEIIEKNYDSYRGFVILHGTDTMAFTASALSFMFKNLGKPVILTGSQVPLQFSRSDALQNLVTAIQIAGNEIYDVKLIPEVAIFFRDTLIRGNRSRKIDATNYFGFASPNYPVLGEVGGDIKIIRERVKKISSGKFHVEKNFSDDVIVIELFPGMNFSYLKKLFEGETKIRGVILKTYGNGNAPTSKEFLDILEYISQKGIIIVDITQCTKGMVKMGLYEASAKLTSVGVLSGADLTPEAAVTKLMYLLGNYSDINLIKQKMQIDMAGEQTISQYDFSEENKNSSSYNSYTMDLDVPTKLKKEYLIKAVTWINDLEISSESQEDIDLSLCITSLDEKIHDSEIIKSELRKKIKVDKKDIHISLDNSIKTILSHSKKVRITIKTNVEVKWKNLSFSIYSEMV